MLMWAGIISFVLGLLEEVLFAFYEARDMDGGNPYLITGIILLVLGVILIIIDGRKGKKEQEAIVDKQVICTKCGLNLTEDCRVCPNCGKEVSRWQEQ